MHANRLLPLLLSLTVVLPAPGRAATELRAGVARVDITPASSMPMYGYANRKCGVSNGTNDPLFAKVLCSRAAARASHS